MTVIRMFMHKKINHPVSVNQMGLKPILWKSFPTPGLKPGAIERDATHAQNKTFIIKLQIYHSPPYPRAKSPGQ